ncbi:hypothetical protein BGZ61DRAFT_72630 [Ilyonectria robusta]|uniref:uncharacterized protein n=1 Tax=Ilyonectria robusta TaxID=1079257 RepID=UPI001E8DBE71|nr:uncharacterized protein BGZ61DRAFT_72630 [Ilyonectria robusta]KAH8676979.1 hypothetical protein BGZ61DRAFT_72630 [Ilyonectria robusta]
MLILTNFDSCDHGHGKPQHSVSAIFQLVRHRHAQTRSRQERDPNGVLSGSSRDLHNLSPTSHRASACGGPVQGASVRYNPVVLGTYFIHITQVEGYWDAVPILVVPAGGLPTRNYHFSRKTTPLHPKLSVVFLRRAPSYEVPPANAVFPFQTSSQPTSRSHRQENKLRMLVLPGRFRPNVPPNVDPHVTMSWSSNA